MREGRSWGCWPSFASLKPVECLNMRVDQQADARFATRAGSLRNVESVIGAPRSEMNT